MITAKEARAQTVSIDSVTNKYVEGMLEQVDKIVRDSVKHGISEVRLSQPGPAECVKAVAKALTDLGYKVSVEHGHPSAVVISW